MIPYCMLPTSLEMLHTASLVHDDVVDESGVRRGQSSVNALLDDQAAVLGGRLSLVYGFEACGHGR